VSFWWRRRRLFDEIMDIMRDIEEMMEELMWGFERSVRGAEAITPGRPIVYGVRITIGPDGRPIVEEFGNVRRRGRRAVISEEREPLIEMYEEKDKVVIIAELPGVEKDDIDVRVKDGKLIIRAESRDRKYYKEVELPEDVKPETAKAKYRNGVLEVTIERKKPKIEEEGGVKVEVE
jgi:HSP20 family protein